MAPRLKAKVLLAQALFGHPDIILLDEPTNNLDLNSVVWLEDFLMDYDGTVLVVSHDRYFLNKIPTRIVELSETGGETFLGAYDYYLEKKSGAITSGRAYLAEMRGEKAKDPYEGMSEKEKRAAQKERETNRKRLEKKREKAEADVERLEKEIRDLDGEMALCSASLDYVKANELLALQTAKKEELTAAYEAWEAAAEELDRFV
jgi:ATP-binding cassette subfamily F protein 3